MQSKAVRIAYEASGLRLLYKVFKRASQSVQRTIAKRLQPLRYSSETFGPPKGLVGVDAYVQQRGFVDIEVYPREVRQEPIQHFEPTHGQLQRCASTDVVPITIQRAHVTLLPHGRVIGQNGLVITDSDHVIEETLGSFRGSSTPHPIFSSIRLPRVQRQEGRLAVVGYNYAHGYYHWMLEVLPRFEILRRSGVAFDRVYMSPLVARFQREALTAIGFNHASAIWATPRTHLKADLLVVPSLPAAPGQIPGWVAAFLRDLFLPKIPVAQTQRLLISRRKAARRRILNEEAVTAALQPLGFREVILEDYSLHEQARLFASAESIVATHGAALTNLVFCSPGTSIIELFAPTRSYNNFQVLSHLMGLRYQGLLTAMHGVSRAATRKQDLIVDVAGLVTYVNSALSTLRCS
jgi:hypothetical protein